MKLSDEGLRHYQGHRRYGPTLRATVRGDQTDPDFVTVQKDGVGRIDRFAARFWRPADG